MKEVKLSQEQIQSLYDFTRQHFVEWYDLQSELVDHLANAIEFQWETNPKISFDEALNFEFRKFGIFGFMDVVEQRTVALNKKYNLIVWKHFKEFFRLPTIVVTAFAIVLFYLVFQQFVYFGQQEYIKLSCQILCLILFVISYTKLFSKRKSINNKKKSGAKRWLFEEIIMGYGSFSAFAIPAIQLFNLSFNLVGTFFQNQLLLLGAAFLLVAYIVIGYIMTIHIPAKAADYLTQTYPEYIV